MIKQVFFLVAITLLSASCTSKKSGSDGLQDEVFDTEEEVIEQTSNVDVEEQEMAYAVDCPSIVTVGFYNLENLFDTLDDPSIFDEDYLPTSELMWGKERYTTKLNNLSKVISQIGKNQQDQDGLDVLGVCEVENRKVLEDLVSTGSLASQPWGIAHFDSPDERGIDVALLYNKNRFTPSSEKAYQTDLPQEDGKQDFTRDVLVVTGNLCGEPAAFIVNHWPSRRGGQEKSSPKREFVAKQVKTIADSLMNARKGINIFIMGDLNDTPFDKSVKTVLKADTTAEATLYNTVAHLQARGIGSHYYREERSMLDQIIVSKSLLQKSGLSIAKNTGQRYAEDWMLQGPENGKYEGFPLRTFVGERYFGGYSDHLPVYLHVNTSNGKQ